MASSAPPTAAAAAAGGAAAAATSPSVAAAAHGNNIRVEDVYDECSELLENGKIRLAYNVLTRNSLPDVLRNQAVASKYTYAFSDMLPSPPKAASQGSSGRCWIFACMNVMRRNLIKKFNLPSDFELSQTYLFFFDKLERVQFFVENILATVDEPADGRLVSYLLQSPLNDGGQWDMLVNLVLKYGVVPKSVFPDPHCATASRAMNRYLTSRLRGFARDLRKLAKQTGDLNAPAIVTAKAAMLEEVTQALVTFFGAPPKQFTWTFKDKDGKYGEVRDISPQDFYSEHAGFDMSKKVSLVNDPRNEFYQLYTVDKLGNMVGGRQATYVNVPIDVMKGYARSMIAAGQPVWFGCDMGKYIDRSSAALDTTVFDYENVFGAAPNSLDKTERLQYGESLMTHAMVFTGFDRDPADPENKVKAWQVENSWGEKGPDKGRWLMTDRWFSEFVYQVVIDVGDADEKTRAVLDLKPRVLPAWDPMGALAASL